MNYIRRTAAVSVGLVASALSLVIVAPASFAAPTSGAASGTQLSCTAAGNALFSPGIGAAPTTQSVTFSQDLSSCNGLETTAGTVTGSLVSAPESCLSTTSYMVGEMTVHWNNNTTSQAAVLYVSTPSSSTVYGIVTEGALEGYAVSGQYALYPLAGNCVTAPVTDVGSAGSLVFSKP